MIEVTFMKINEVSYKWSGTLSKRRSTEMIVLHHADAKSCTTQDIHKWHLKRGWTGFGYHFLVRKDGQIFRGRPEDTIGAHISNYNSRSIGICFEGDYMEETMPRAQLEAGKELVAYLKDKYNINKVKGHRDLMATSCPGDKFPFDEIANASKVANSTSSKNLILEFQKAAVADGFEFSKYGCDGDYGTETESVMKQCIVKKRSEYMYPNATKLVQRLLGVKADGKCGPNTDKVIKAFQEKNGLVADGVVGLNTWKKLLGIN
jgi:N-acetyl-anhydromuramyl-L-alanine amidase AmpD